MGEFTMKTPDLKFDWRAARQVLYTILATYVFAVRVLQWEGLEMLGPILEPLTFAAVGVFFWNFFDKRGK